MRAWMVFLAMVPACGFNSPSNPNSGPDANNSVDANSDATPDASGPQFGTFIKVTFLSPADAPMAPLTWSNNVDINTDMSTLCNTRNDQASRYCVVVGTNITLMGGGTTLTAHGNKPLVLLATATFDLQGIINVSSKRGGMTGAGAAASCPNATAATANSGGFGGSFGGKGGDGSTAATPDGTNGIAAPALPTPPTDLRGGCPGGNGSSMPAGTGAAGGSGGGAVLIIADKIQLNGKINASGAGGQAGPAAGGGGGGGGSGGMIVLDALTIVPNSNLWLYANGGGGGQGGTSTGPGSGAGTDGQESSDPFTVASGGNASNRSGGPGGDGSAGITSATDAVRATNSGSGGAGGGGAGYIRAPSLTGLMISPTPIPL